MTIQRSQWARRVPCLAAVAILFPAAPLSGVCLAQGPASQRSGGYFEQMSVVFAHPRCLNCHTGETFPRQGDDRHRHTMNILRGPNDRGAPGLHCGTCHQSSNQAASGVPGASDWHLAPIRMSWAGLTAGQLCRAIRNPSLGAMTPDQMVAHFSTGLVRWAWEPGLNAQGSGRASPPLSHAKFIALTKLWIASGAACPD